MLIEAPRRRDALRQPVRAQRRRRGCQFHRKALRLHTGLCRIGQLFHATKQTQTTANFQQQAIWRHADARRQAARPASQSLYRRCFARRVARHQGNGRRQHARRCHANTTFHAGLSRPRIGKKNAPLLDNRTRRWQGGVGFERQ